MYHSNYANNELSDIYIGDDTDSFGNPDSIFGLGKNRQLKKADKKAAKAVKALSKGNTKAAARKQKKADSVYTKVLQRQAVATDLQKKQSDINRNQQMLQATTPKVTESMEIEPGQIGSEAGGVTYSASQAAQQTMGGGGAGDIAANDSTSELSSTADGETSTPDSPKELKGVTVGGKTNWLIIGIIVIIAIAGIIYLSKSVKK